MDKSITNMSRLKIFIVPLSIAGNNYEVIVREFQSGDGSVEYRINSRGDGLKSIFPDGEIAFCKSGNSGNWEFDNFDQTTEEGRKRKGVLQKVISYLEEKTVDL